MSFEKRVTFDSTRAVSFFQILITYIPLGTSFPQALRQLIISNFTNVTLDYSFDGVTDHFSLGAGGTIELSTHDFSSPDEIAQFVSGTQLFVKHRGTPAAIDGTMVDGAFLT